MLVRPLLLSPEAAAAQARFDRIAASAHADPLNRTAFTEAALGRDVDDARAALCVARKAPPESNSKADRLKARKGIKLAVQALNHAEAAVAAEKRGETAAPLVQRCNQVEGGVMLREARVVPGPGKRLSLVDPLDRLHCRGTISTAQQLAGHRYRRAWEAAGVDTFPIGLGSGVDGGSRAPPGSGNRRIERAVGSSIELDRLRRSLGARGTALVEHVVVHELDLAGWAARQQLNAQVAMGMLLMALDVLVQRRLSD